MVFILFCLKVKATQSLSRFYLLLINEISVFLIDSRFLSTGNKNIRRLFRAVAVIVFRSVFRLIFIGSDDHRRIFRRTIFLSSSGFCANAVSENAAVIINVKNNCFNIFITLFYINLFPFKFGERCRNYFCKQDAKQLFDVFAVQNGENYLHFFTFSVIFIRNRKLKR